MSQTYTIVVSEAQLAILTEALNRLDVNVLTGTCAMTGSPYTEEAALLKDMIVDVPEIEKQMPGIVHGFAY